MNDEFWTYLQQLVDEHPIVIDRPQGSSHPRFEGKTYPIDYGYLQGTTSVDASDVDIWVGSLGQAKVTGVLCTVDLLKKDTELKILLDCSLEEIQAIDKFVNTSQMKGMAIIKQ